MSIENLSFLNQLEIDGIKFDGILREEQQRKVVITDDPVQNGFSISDNAYLEPATLIFDVIATDSPLGLESVGLVVDQVTGLFGSSTEESVTRSSQTYLKLEELMENLEPMTVNGTIKPYENMIITGLTPLPRTSETMGSLVIKVEFKQLITSNSVVRPFNESQVSGSTLARANKENIGRVNPEPPSDGERTSALKSISDWVFQ